MKCITFSLLLLLLLPIVTFAQSGPPAQGVTCRETPCEKSEPDPFIDSNQFDTQTVPTTVPEVETSTTRISLLQLIIDLMMQLQSLLVQLRDAGIQPAPVPTPEPSPSPFPPHPDELGATCSNYTYDTCPAFCSKECNYTNQCANPDSDFCGEPDCNGPGSCYYDPTPRQSEPDSCSIYTYSSCPATCEKQCVSSSCKTLSNGETICTSDCDGANSCRTPNS